MDKDLDDLTEVVRSHRGRRLPVVLTKSEVAKLLQHLHGVYGLMAGMIYGAGLRLSECVKLRIKDIDLETNLITVVGAKGNKDRTTMLAERIKPELLEHMEKAKDLYLQDRKNKLPGIWLPNALERKYPNAGNETERGRKKRKGGRNGTRSHRKYSLLIPAYHSGHFRDILQI